MTGFPSVNEQALHLVARELAATLNEVRIAPEAAAETPADKASVARGADLLRDAHGVLRVVEVYGAALLAEEMEHTSRWLAGNDTDARQFVEGLDALMRSSVQLPTYLERVLSGGRDLALVLQPLLNDLRAVRGAPLLSEGTLLSLNLSSEKSPAERAPRPGDQKLTVSQWARRLRTKYQAGLLALIRGGGNDKGLEALAEVANRMEGVATTVAVDQLWRVIGALLDALAAGGLQPSVTVKRLLGHVDERGADVILSEKEDETIDQTFVRVTNSRQALARIASNFYGNPSAKVFLVGITGTNGKTTTTYLLESILKKAGYGVGVIGTINYRYGQKIVPALNTTPESLDLQRILWEMSGEGISHVIMEVSSHGLDLDRVFGCQFDGTLFTNFTSDHLDYHQTLDRYFESKRKLFFELLVKSRKTGRFAVTNADDPRGEEIVRGVDLPVLRYGLSSSCDFSAGEVTLSFEGISCRIKTPKGEFQLRSKLIGRFNLYNILGGGLRWGGPSFSRACAAPPSLPSPVKGEGVVRSDSTAVESL